MVNLTLGSIPQLFHGRTEESVLSIQKQEDDSYALTIDASGDVESTLGNLKEIIGEDRLRQICLIPELGIAATDIDQNTLVLTKNIVRKIFIGLAHIRKQDIQVSGHEKDKGKEYADLLQAAIPFATFEDFQEALMGGATDFSHFLIDKAGTSGKGFKGLTERVYLTMHHYFKMLEEKSGEAKFLRDAELLTSRLADREMQEGSVLLLSDGCFYVDKVIAAGGAYLSILRDLEDAKAPKIIFRGTAMRSNATQGWMSGANDVMLEMGMMGIKSVWPELSAYLDERGISSVEVWGKSLGGAYAQEIAILIEGTLGIKVDQLVTYCSTGTGEAINSIFKSEILDKRDAPFKMCVIRNGGDDSKNELDYIPRMGGVHIGEGTDEMQCEIDLYYIYPKESEMGPFPENPSLFHLFRQFIHSFSNGHCRQTTLEDFSWVKIDDRKEIDLHLRLGRQLEVIRKCFAYVIHLLTLSFFNGKSFASFFYLQKSRFKL